MLDTSLQQQLENQGKDEVRNEILKRTEADYARFADLMRHADDKDNYEIALLTLESVFKALKKAGVKYD